MEEAFTRTRLLIGDERVSILQRSRVALFGVGGVGGHCAEALVRCGIGEIHLFDSDMVVPSNLNRQLVALHSTLGMPKVKALANRLHDIIPECRVVARQMFYLPENADKVDLKTYNFVVDCIDTVRAKLELARRCHSAGIPLIAAMGAANRTDPTRIKLADLSKTQGDPLARIVRQTLRREGIRHLTVAYSDEPPLHPVTQGEPLPSYAPVPAAMGLAIASEVVRQLTTNTQADTND